MQKRRPLPKAWKPYPWALPFCLGPVRQAGLPEENKKALEGKKEQPEVDTGTARDYGLSLGQNGENREKVFQLERCKRGIKISAQKLPQVTLKVFLPRKQK